MEVQNDICVRIFHDESATDRSVDGMLLEAVAAHRGTRTPSFRMVYNKDKQPAQRSQSDYAVWIPVDDIHEMDGMTMHGFWIDRIDSHPGAAASSSSVQTGWRVQAVHCQPHISRLHVISYFVSSYPALGLQMCSSGHKPLGGDPVHECAPLATSVSAALRAVTRAKVVRNPEEASLPYALVRLACACMCSSAKTPRPLSSLGAPASLRCLARRLAGARLALGLPEAQLDRLSMVQAVVAMLFSYLLIAALWAQLDRPLPPLRASDVRSGVQSLTRHVIWLSGAPAGIKLHAGLAHLLADATLCILRVSEELVISLRSWIQLCIWFWLRCSLLFGLQMTCAVGADLTAIATAPIAAWYCCMVLVYRCQLDAMKFMWKMVRGTVNVRQVARSLARHVWLSLPGAAMGAARPVWAWTEHRRTLLHPQGSRRWSDQQADNEEIVVEQLIVGVLLLAPLVATFPTTLLFYTAACVLHLGSAALHALLSAASAALDCNGLAFAIICMLQRCGADVVIAGDTEFEYVTAYKARVRSGPIVHSPSQTGMRTRSASRLRVPGSAPPAFKRDPRSEGAPTVQVVHFRARSSPASLRAACQPCWEAFRTETRDLLTELVHAPAHCLAGRLFATAVVERALGWIRTLGHRL